MPYEFTGTRILTNQAAQFIDQKVLFIGWLYAKQLLATQLVITLRDRAGLLCFIVPESEAKKLENIHAGSVLRILSTVTQKNRDELELIAHEITVELPVRFQSPIAVNEPIAHTAENLTQILENRVLNIRNVQEQAIFRINNSIEQAIRKFLQEHEFLEFHSPKILACASEGGSEVFKINYFGQEATLAQSAQFYKQIMAAGFERVFEIGSTFRAEPAISTRHMTDFMTLDVEMSFITDLSDVMGLLYQMLINTTESVWQSHVQQLEQLSATKPKFSKNFPVITLKELHQLCYEQTGHDFRHEPDPTPFEEEWICAYSAQNWSSDAVFITEFPISTMRFYQYRNTCNPEVIDRFDLLFKGVEICTGGRREHRYNKLIEQMKLLGIDPEDPTYAYYLQTFKYGAASSGGFGLGLARLTQLIIGLNSVKEATIFVRDRERLLP